MKNFYILLTIIFSCLLFFQKNVFSLAISPFFTVIETESGNSGTKIVQVINEYDTDYEINASLMDISFDEKGNRLIKPIGSFPNSVAKYLRVTPNKFILKGKETKEVQVSIQVPKDSIGGRQAMVYFEGTPVISENFAQKSKKIKMAIRLGLLVLQQTKGTVITKSRITDVNISLPSKSKPLIIKMNVLNQGNSHIEATGTAAIIKQDDTFIGKVDFNNMIIFPNRSKTLTAEYLGKIEKGFYHILITYMYSPDKSVVIDKSFEIN